MELNRASSAVCAAMIRSAEILRLTVQTTSDGCRVVDCGVHAKGGLEAGRWMAVATMAGLGEVQIGLGMLPGQPGPAVCVRTDQPVAACMASQYAGWRISKDGYFAMGSGPMRALAAKEPLFEQIGPGVSETCAVGALESATLPPNEVCRDLADQCGIEHDQLTLLVATTSSTAGTVQVVARSVETALHKLYDLGFALELVESGFGAAPIPPPAADDLTAMGRTNDAVLYGAEVTLWVRGDEEELRTLGPKLPSTASPDHGRPFADIFTDCNRDFYKIDPALFAPAVITLNHLPSGRVLRFGRVEPKLLERSFGYL